MNISHLDKDERLSIIAEKWQDDHERIRQLEKDVLLLEELKKAINAIGEKLDDVYDCLNGNMERKGWMGTTESRVDALESWRRSTTSYTKSRAALMWSIITGMIIVFGQKIIDKLWR